MSRKLNRVPHVEAIHNCRIEFITYLKYITLKAPSNVQSVAEVQAWPNAVHIGIYVGELHVHAIN